MSSAYSFTQVSYSAERATWVVRATFFVSNESGALVNAPGFEEVYVPVASPTLATIKDTLGTFASKVEGSINGELVAIMQAAPPIRFSSAGIQLPS
jgi:hypothetical protein